jgi:hypothetical protein
LVKTTYKKLENIFNFSHIWKKSMKDIQFSKEQGQAFCFLPLPLETGLPVHVNGHFSLDHEARRNLWTDDKEGYRSAWNKDSIVKC